VDRRRLRHRPLQPHLSDVRPLHDADVAATILFGAGHFEVSPAQWFANLLVAAPVAGQPYVDTSYWSLVIEIVFYAWVAAFIALGIFPRRIAEWQEISLRVVSGLFGEFAPSG
jgi:peptidoglycan/LPS O-acetylase OafA/YrhL